MSYSNRIFNVNGKGQSHFQKALDLAILQSGFAEIAGYIMHKEKGMILCWHQSVEDHFKESFTSFPVPMQANDIGGFIWQWLQQDKETELSGFDANADHDGSNRKGWRIYCEDWGHVETHYAICAIKPVYIWHGK